MAVQRGEIYFVDLNPGQGREQSGRLSDAMLEQVEATVRRCLGL